MKVFAGGEENIETFTQPVAQEYLHHLTVASHSLIVTVSVSVPGLRLLILLFPAGSDHARDI